MGAPSIAAQVVALTHLNVAQLRERWQKVFNEPTTQRHRQYMIKRLAWEIQRRESGEELSPAAKQKLDEIQDREFRHTPPETWFRGARHNRPGTEPAPVRRKPVRNNSALKPGTILTKKYFCEQVVVTVRGDREFECGGEVYRSLSAVAKAVTGSHCSGIAFFGLTKRGGAA